jgi:hypothetical protein
VSAKINSSLIVSNVTDVNANCSQVTDDGAFLIVASTE